MLKRHGWIMVTIISNAYMQWESCILTISYIDTDTISELLVSHKNEL